MSDSHFLALLSQEAYTDAPDLIVVDGVEFLIREIGINTYAVAFRGTTFNFKDILRDMRGIPWYDCRLGWCHKGFLVSARKAFPAVLDRLNRLGAIDIVFTGHSLGAAHATLCAAWMTWEALPSQLQLYTFGSPRVGRTLESTLKGVRCRRYVNGADIVTSLPSPLIQRHVGPPMRLGNGDDGFLDHRIAEYVKALE